ncbi:MAG TPA: hypothetical protein VGD52_02470 [Pseudoduganella sp.]
MSLIAAVVMAMSGAGQAAGDAPAEDLQLVCYGGAQKTTSQVNSRFEWDADQHKYVPKMRIETGKDSFDTAINVSIHGVRGTIKLPKSLVPPIHSGASAEGWPIEDLIVGHNQIRGKFRLNALNQPTLAIDRRSGVMTIEGLIKFSGRCDADEGHRRF